MKQMIIVGVWAMLTGMPLIFASSSPGAGQFCIDENDNGTDCEVIYTGAGDISIEICVKNTSQPDEKGNPGPDMTVKLDCKGNNPGNLTIAPGETKCASCKIKKVTACDTAVGIEACGEYTTTSW